MRCVTRAGFADAMRETLVSHGEGTQGVEGRRRFFGILFLPPEDRRSFFFGPLLSVQIVASASTRRRIPVIKRRACNAVRRNIGGGSHTVAARGVERARQRSEEDSVTDRAWAALRWAAERRTSRRRSSHASQCGEPTPPLAASPSG